MSSQVAKCILFLLAMFLPVGLIGQTPPLDPTNTLTIEAQDSIIYGTAQCCGHQGATGSSISSSAGWSTGYNGAFFNSNGTGRGDTGAQLNPTIPSWRMALGSGDQEWPGAGDQFTIGRVDPGGNYLHPNILFTINNAGRVNVPGQSSFLFGTVV